MMSPSKIFFDSLQQRFLNLFHQSYNEPRLETTLRKNRLAQDRIMFQTSTKTGSLCLNEAYFLVISCKDNKLDCKAIPAFVGCPQSEFCYATRSMQKSDIWAQFSPSR